MSDQAGKGRRMIFPYTFSAKVAQFPYKYYWNKSWLFKYYCFALLVTAPIFHKIANASYSPNNVKTWEEIRRKRFSGEHH